MLLAFLTNEYDQKKWSIPDVESIELIKIRMEEFGYKPKDLSDEYGDKGTISKVLNYKQPFSLTMIRKFSKMSHPCRCFDKRIFDKIDLYLNDYHTKQATGRVAYLRELKLARE